MHLYFERNMYLFIKEEQVKQKFLVRPKRERYLELARVVRLLRYASV